MVYTKWVGFCFLSASLVGCSFMPVATAETARSYNYDALNAYMSDFDSPGQTTSFDSAPTDSFYGHWVAKIDLDEEMKKDASKQKTDPMVDPDMQKMGEEFAKAMASAFTEMMTMELDIEKDGTFKMTMMGMPMEGKWKQVGSTLSLVPETFMGLSSDDFAKQQGHAVPKSEPLDLQISADQQTLIARNPGGEDPKVIEFKRK